MQQTEMKRFKNHDDNNMQMKSTQGWGAAPYEECTATLKVLSLPEILQKIFGYLDVQSKGRAAQVSKLWHDNIERPQMWRDVMVKLNYNKYGPPHYMIAPSEYQHATNIMTVKQHCSRSFPLLTKLIIDDRCNSGDKIINQIVKSFRNLVSLKLSNCFNEITDKGLTQIIDNLKSLRHLQLTSCINITDKGVAALCGVNNMAGNGNIPILHSLSLSNTHFYLTDAALNYLSIGQPELRSLNLSGCSWITDIGLESLSRLGNLHVLDISRCDRISDDGLVHLAQMMNLTDLNLSWHSYITSAGLEQLASGDSQLTSLTLEHHTQMNDQFGPPLARLTNLTKLILTSTNIGDTVLQCLANGPGAKRLDTLNLEYCHKLTNEAGPSLALMSNLTKLMLGYTNIGDTVLKCLANGIGVIRLDTLSLNNCIKLTDEAGRHLAMMSNLQVLDLSGTNLSNAGLDHLVIAGNLKIENLSLARCENVTNLRSLAYLPRIKTVSWTPLSNRIYQKWRMELVEVVTMKMNRETGQWE